MRDDLGNLAWLNTVIEREVHVVGHLNRLVSRDQSCESNNAAISRRKTRTFPQFGKRPLRVLVKRWSHHSGVVYDLHQFRLLILSSEITLPPRCGEKSERGNGYGDHFHSNLSGSRLGKDTQDWPTNS